MIETFFQGHGVEGEFLYGNFPLEFTYLIDEDYPTNSIYELNFNGSLIKSRFGEKSNNFGKVFVLTFEPRYVKSTKLFRQLLNMSIVSIGSLSDYKKEIVRVQNEQNEELIHNLTSLNTYSIQDLFALIPQNLLSENINKQKGIIKEIISQKPKVTVDTLLQLIKYNVAMKIEFSVFEKSLHLNPKIQLINDSIRGFILSILQIFIADFDKLNIIVDVYGSEKRLNIELESLSVSLFYLFENAVKYSSRNTSFKIIFREESDSFCVVLDMVSIRIEDSEVERLCEKYYRAEIAEKIHETGKGIGMYKIGKTLKMNNAILEIKPRVSSHTRKTQKAIYEHNQFIIRFMGQGSFIGSQ